MSSQPHTQVPTFPSACTVFHQLQEAHGAPLSSRSAPVVPVCSMPAHGFLQLQEAEEKGDEQPGKEKFEDDFFDTMSSDATGGAGSIDPGFQLVGHGPKSGCSWPEAPFGCLPV